MLKLLLTHKIVKRTHLRDRPLMIGGEGNQEKDFDASSPENVMRGFLFDFSPPPDH